MKIFCPSCGSDNEGMAGGRVTCRACTTSFAVPADLQGPPPPGPALIQATDQAGATLSPTGLPVASRTNALAIVSLVSGLLCCVPLISPLVAVVAGLVSLNQIGASRGAEGGKGLAIAGIALGILSCLGSGLLGVLSALGQHG